MLLTSLLAQRSRHVLRDCMPSVSMDMVEFCYTALKFNRIPLHYTALTTSNNETDWYLLVIRLKMDPIPGICIGLISNPIPIYWVEQYNTNTRYWVHFLSDPGIELVTLWMIPKREAHGRSLCMLDWDWNVIPRDWITRGIQSLIFDTWYRKINPIP
jgi:hypothetical protein